MQTKVNIEQALGKVGTISRQNPITSVPRIVEDDNVYAGKFVFEGTNKETQVKGVLAGATSVEGLAVFGYQMGQTLSNNLKINIGEEIRVVKKGYVFITSTTNANYKDKVWVKVEDGTIKTSSQETEEGFIDTGWRVETSAPANQVCEISNI